jgi:hypothetical protein
MKLYWNTANGLQRSRQPTPPCTFDRLARRVKTADKDLGGYENFVFYEK